MRASTRHAVLCGAWVGLVALAGAGEEKADVLRVGPDRRVSIEYTLSTDGGEVAETNAGGKPLIYQHGTGQMPPALEAALVGLAAGASKEVDLTPEQAYGPVRPELFQTIDAAQIPEEARKTGSVVIAQSESGEKRPVRVHEIKGDKIVLDLNHPLSGKRLHFAIKILAIE